MDKKYLNLFAALLMIIGASGIAFVVGYIEGANSAGEFYNETITDLKSNCIRLTGMNSSIKNSFAIRHGDEGVFKPEDLPVLDVKSLGQIR